MTDCPTPYKLSFRSKAAAARWHRRVSMRGKDTRLYPYQCAAGHWHLTHGQPGWNDIPRGVDAELTDIARRAADRFPEAMVTAQGWTRDELIDAILTRLRNKYRHMRDTNQLERDSDGRIGFKGVDR